MALGNFRSFLGRVITKEQIIILLFLLRNDNIHKVLKIASQDFRVYPFFQFSNKQICLKGVKVGLALDKSD